MPEHKHTVSYGSSLGVLGVLAAADDTLGTNSSAFINNTGGSDAHNNLQPYIVVYMFKRTA
jgi:microcystin-dependent protein